MEKTENERKTKEMTPQSQEKTQWGTRDTDLKDPVNNMQVPKKGRK